MHICVDEYEIVDWDDALEALRDMEKRLGEVDDLRRNLREITSSRDAWEKMSGRWKSKYEKKKEEMEEAIQGYGEAVTELIDLKRRLEELGLVI